MDSARRYRFLIVLVLASSPGWLLAENASPVIPAYQRFYAGDASDQVEAGRLLLSELRCVACHSTDAATAAALQSKQAPDLRQVGARIRPDYYAAYLSDVHAAKPGTTMPQLLRNLSASERSTAVQAIAHYLADSGSFRETRRRESLIANGKKLYQQVGCVACHDPDPGQTDPLPTSKPLGDLAKKYSVGSLATFLQDPLAVRHSGRMPNLHLNAEDATAIAQYLLPDLNPHLPNNLRYAYYESNFNQLPNFQNLTPRQTGETDGFRTDVALRPNQYAIRYEGYFNAPREGEYQFFLTSDDGSRLTIGERRIVDNDGVHPSKTEQGKLRLAAGPHPISVEFFNAGGPGHLQVEYRGPQISRRELFAELSLSPEPTAADSLRSFQPDPMLVAQGEKWFSQVGCANCHESGANPPPFPPLAAQPLAEMNLALGCLADQPSSAAADYRLTQEQRQAIRQALEKLPDDQPTPAQSIVRTMTQMNCYACHERDQRGGVEQSRNPFFRSTQQEMGDEGRLPPHLNGVGGKLNSAWLAHIMKDGADDRPYMLTRMPKFGERNVGQLTAPLEQLDQLPQQSVAIDEKPAHIKAIGRHMVGDKVFGCIKCHTFDGVQASGVQGIDMTLMTRRLNHAWFHQYVVNPPRYRPGTRMPTAWPNGQSVMKNILDGSTERQIEAIWRYLSDRNHAAKPYGLGGEPIELVAYDHAVVYRNFIEGAGPRAIGVGYPAHGNLAIDANQLRLALIWQGAFIDASRHWSGRGKGFQPPLGDNIYRFAPGPDFYALQSETADWPQQDAKMLGMRFQGYRLDEKRRPTFRYQYDGVQVEDFYESTPGDRYPTITRTIRFHGRPKAPLYYRAATGDIQDLGSGRYQVNKTLTIELSAHDPILRSEKKDLLIPLRFENGEATIRQTYVW
ncbi:MAG: c-type cytochrome [Blastopirellula sp. JB062]